MKLNLPRKFSHGKCVATVPLFCETSDKEFSYVLRGEPDLVSGSSLSVASFSYPESKKSLILKLRSPFPVPRAPFLIFRFPFPVPRSPFSVSRSPFPVPRFPFPVPRSPFPVPRSPFPVPRSPFPVPRSPFPVPRSPFPVPRSSFSVPRSPFLVIPFQFLTLGIYQYSER